MNLWIIILYFTLLSIDFFFWLYWRKKLPGWFNWVGWILAMSIAFDLTGIVLKELKYQHFWVYHVFRPIDYTLHCLLFSSVIINKWIKNAALVSIPLFFAICLGLVLTNTQPINGPTSMTLSTQNMCFILFTGWILFEHVKDNSRTPSYQVPVFWIAAGTLLYCSGTFVTTFLLNSDFKRENKASLFVFNIVLNFTIYLCYFTSILVASRKPFSKWERN